ncbi:hypothetical protein [Kitasatospora herbaricolor]|uniref:Uncharacterized protein n=1 Tax=Kitasatospora herbaricolor TaxID=68217 RepID=A0ABZ1WHG2_9ACTN|nr:hypothetical protein [Kitasatospora herbaricolor]
MARFLRLGTALAGIALMAYGLYGLLNDHYITDPADVLVWAVGGLVLHDGLWVPLVCLAGSRFARGPVLRAWLIVAAALTAVGLPAVLRAGDDHGNPTLLPLPYLRNYLLTLAVTAAVALFGVAAAAVRRRRRQRPGPP